MCVNILLIVFLFIIGKTGNSLRIYTLWLIHVMEYYTAVKMNELPIWTTLWINFNNNIEYKTKKICSMVLFTGSSKRGKIKHYH